MRIFLLLLLVSTAASALPSVYPPHSPPPVCPPPGRWVGTFPNRRCEYPPKPESARGTLRPRFYITHVVYSVPGRLSSVRYESGDAVTHSMTMAESFEQNLDVTLGVKSNLFWAGGDFGITISHGLSGGESNTTDISLATQSGYHKPGAIDYVDHDDDEVWFIPEPLFDVVATPESPWGPARVEWAWSAAGVSEPTYLTVGELRGTRAIPEGVQRFLDYHRITPDLFPELLSADPFVNGVQPNQHMDPARFRYVAAFPYMPISVPGYPPSVQSYSIKRGQKDTNTLKSDVSYGVTLDVAGEGGFLAHAYFKIKDKVRFVTSSIETSVSDTSTTNSLAVAQPAFGYTGPTVLRVYEDTVWGTFVFQLDWY